MWFLFFMRFDSTVLLTCHHSGQLWNGCCVCDRLQYFEYTSKKELRHNIAKELCLQVEPNPRPVRMQVCALKKGESRPSPHQEWIFTQVCLLVCDWAWKWVWCSLPMFCFFVLFLSYLCRKISWRIPAVGNVYMWRKRSFWWTIVMRGMTTNAGASADILWPPFRAFCQPNRTVEALARSRDKLTSIHLDWHSLQVQSQVWMVWRWSSEPMWALTFSAQVSPALFLREFYTWDFLWWWWTRWW